MEPIYTLNGNVATTSEFAAGPWDPSMQHGSAPSSLVAWVAERIPTRTPMHLARITVDLLRPVPIATPLEIKADIVREGKKIQVCAVTLSSAGNECVRASVLKIRSDDLEFPKGAGIAPLKEKPPEEGVAPRGMLERRNAFLSGLEVRAVRGAFGEPGPAAIWFRVKRPMIAGEEISPLLRAVVAADFCNGASSTLDFKDWTFVNADLTISLARYPVGEWVLLDAESWLGDKGSGVAFAGLADMHGYFGRAIQSLVIEKR